MLVLSFFLSVSSSLTMSDKYSQQKTGNNLNFDFSVFSMLMLKTSFKTIPIFILSTKHRLSFQILVVSFPFSIQSLRNIRLSNKQPTLSFHLQHCTVSFRSLRICCCLLKVLRLISSVAGFWFCLSKIVFCGSTCIDFMWHTNCIHLGQCFSCMHLIVGKRSKRLQSLVSENEDNQIRSIESDDPIGTSISSSFFV